jgi:hypothetical protein
MGNTNCFLHGNNGYANAPQCYAYTCIAFPVSSGDSSHRSVFRVYISVTYLNDTCYYSDTKSKSTNTHIYKHITKGQDMLFCCTSTNTVNLGNALPSVTLSLSKHDVLPSSSVSCIQWTYKMHHFLLEHAVQQHAMYPIPLYGFSEALRRLQVANDVTCLAF